MKRSWYRTAAVILVVSLLAGGLAFAQRGGRGGARGGFRRPGRARGSMQFRGARMGGFAAMRGPVRGDGVMARAMLRRLDLTDEQEEKIKDILEDGREKSEAAREAVEQAVKALRETASEDGDDKAIREAAAKVGEAIGEQAVLRVKTAEAIKDVLTDEQKEELEELKEKAKERAEEMRERREDMRERREERRERWQEKLGDEDFGRFGRRGPGAGLGFGGAGPRGFGRGRGWGERPYDEGPRGGRGFGGPGRQGFRDGARGRRGNW